MLRPISRDLKLVFGLLTAAALIVSFQNCSTPIEFSKFELKSLANNGNGTGYDGKPFVNYGFCGGSTTLALKSVIVVKADGSGELLRENCQDVATPIAIPRGDMVTPATDPHAFVFKSEIFDDAEPSGGARRKLTRVLCWSYPNAPVHTEARVWHFDDPLLTNPTNLVAQLKSDDGYNSGRIERVTEATNGQQINYSANDPRTGYSVSLSLYVAGGSSTTAYGNTSGGSPAGAPMQTGGLQCFTQGVPDPTASLKDPF